MPPGFRAINNPYLTPLGAQLIITGIPQFNAAAVNIARQFTAIGQAAAAVATQVTALNTSLAAFNVHSRALQTIGQRAQRITPVSAGARGIPTRGQRPGANPLGALGSIEPGGQARAFFGQRAGPLSIYTRLPITLNATAVAAVAAAAAITGMGAKLEQTARQVQVFGSTTENQMNEVREAAIGMSREFTAGAGDIAQGALQLAKAGAPLDDLNTNLLRSVTVLNQASQGEVNMADASDTVIQGITALNLKWEEAPRFVGGLIAAVQGSTASFSDFTLQLKQTLPVAGLLNFKYEELFASLALLNQAGLRGSIAGTALKNAIIAIADPTSEAGEILQKYNISLFDAQGKALPLIEVLGRLVDAFGKTNEGVSDAQRFFETTDIFNTRQILAALSVINQGNEAYAGFLATVRGGLDTGEQVAKSLQKNLIDQLRLIFNNTVAAAHAITGEFLPALTQIATRVRESMTADNLQGYKDFGKTINELITFNNSFANSLIREVAPGVLLLNESIGVLATSFTPVNSGAEGAGGALLRFAALISAVSGVIARDIATWPDTFRQLEAAGIRLAVMVQGIRRLITNADVAKSLSDQLRDAENVALAQAASTGAGIAETFSMAFEARMTVFRTFFRNEAEVLINELAATGKSATQVAAETALGITGVTVDGIITMMNEADAIHEAAILRMRARANAFILSQNPTISREQQQFNEANVNIGIGGSSASPLPVVRPIGGGASFPPSSGGGGSNAGDELEKIAAQVRAALSGIPALTEDLVDFIAQIAQDTPQRLAPMLSAINSSSEIISQLVVSKRDLLAIDLQLIGVARRLTELHAQAAKLDIERAIASIAFDKQLIGLSRQLLEIDSRRWPIEDALRKVDREIAKLSQENLVSKRALLEIDLQELPSRQRIEDIEREIAKHNRTNFDLEKQRIQIALDSIGFKQRIEDIDREIEKLNRTNFDVQRELLQISLESIGFKQQIEDIDREIAKHNRRNIDVERQRLQISLATIGLRHQIEDIEENIAELSRTNFASQRAQLQGELAALPIRQRIRDIEQQITDSIDRRAGIQSQLSQLDLADIEDELAVAWEKNDVDTIVRLEEEKALIEARLKGDEKAERAAERVRLGLELDKVALEDQLTPIERRLNLLTNTEEKQRLLNDISKTFLEEEKQRLEALIKPHEDILKLIERRSAVERIRIDLIILGLEEEKQRIQDQLEPLELRRIAIERTAALERIRIDLAIINLEQEKQRIQDQLEPLELKRIAIEREAELERLRAALIIANLEQEKQRIEDQLEPLEEKRRAIEREVAIEILRNQIIITHLEEEKRRLQEQLIPLEDERRAIERIKAEVELLRAAALIEFEERSIQIREQILQEELRQAELEATRREQELLFGQLVLGFADALIASKAFTGQEALEVAQRLRLWDESIAKLAETIIEFQRLSAAAGDAAKSIREIERDVTVTITTIHVTRHVTEGTPPPVATADPGATAASLIPAFAGGGLVPGRRGQPMLIMAHGGERIISITNASVPAHVSAKQTGSITNNIFNYETNYNVNPSYSTYQSPAALTDDLRALVMASSRG